jgi:hypothetical protein
VLGPDFRSKISGYFMAKCEPVLGGGLADWACARKRCRYVVGSSIVLFSRWLTMDATKSSLDHIPQCNRCAHYFITHDMKFRYGCRALDFKSQRQPIREVVAASGQSCLYFQARQQD